MSATDMAELGSLIARAFHADQPEAVAADVTDFRRAFDTVHYVR